MFLWISLLFFYGMTALLDICGGFKKANRKVLTGFLLLPMFILVAFRADYVGPDTDTYSFFYDNIAQLDSLKDALDSLNMEYGFVLFEYLCSRIGISYLGFQFLVSSFIFCSFYRFIHKHSQYIAGSCFLVFANNIMFGTMNVVRMWIAVAILLYAVEALLNRQLKIFVVIVLIASCFHLSALCFVIVYPLKQIKWNKIKLLIIFVCAIGITLFARPVFAFLFSSIGQYENYLSRFDQSMSLAMVLDLIIEILLFVFISIAYRKDVFVKNSKNELIHLLYTFQIISVCISIVGLSNNIMGRVAYYFSSYSLIGIPLGMMKIKNPNSRLIFATILIACISAKFLVVLQFRPEWYQVIPYGFWR